MVTLLQGFMQKLTKIQSNKTDNIAIFQVDLSKEHSLGISLVSLPFQLFLHLLCRSNGSKVWFKNSQRYDREGRVLLSIINFSLVI